MRLPIATGISSRDGISDKDPGVSNALKVITESGEALETRPGMVLSATCPSPDPRGIVSFDGVLLSIYGSNLYQYVNDDAPDWEIVNETFGTMSIDYVGGKTVCLLDHPDSPDGIYSFTYYGGSLENSSYSNTKSWNHLHHATVVRGDSLYLFPAMDSVGNMALAKTINGYVFSHFVFPFPGDLGSKPNTTCMSSDGSVILLSTGGKNFKLTGDSDWVKISDGPEIRDIIHVGGKFYGSNTTLPILYEINLSDDVPVWSILDNGTIPKIPDNYYSLYEFQNKMVVVAMDSNMDGGVLVGDPSGTLSFAYRSGGINKINGVPYMYTDPENIVMSFAPADLPYNIRVSSKDAYTWATYRWDPPATKYKYGSVFFTNGGSDFCMCNGVDTYTWEYHLSVFSLTGGLRPSGSLTGDFFDFSQGVM